MRRSTRYCTNEELPSDYIENNIIEKMKNTYFKFNNLVINNSCNKQQLLQQIISIFEISHRFYEIVN